MQMPEGEPHPSTLAGFKGRRDLERSVTRSRSGRKKKRVEFEDVQPQDIPNPTKDNFPRRCITQLPDGVSHIYYTRKELTNRDSMRVHGTFTSVFKVRKDIATLPTARDAVVNIFGQFMDIRLGNLDNRLIQALIERWWPTTHTFLFPFAEIGVTPLDFTMLTSLSIDRYPTQYWFYKYCGVGYPIVKEEVKYPSYLRLRAWGKENRRKTNGQAANLFIIGKYHIDHRTVKTITLEPWIDSTVSETEDVLNAKLISRKRIPLQVRFADCEQFMVGEVRETYASYRAEQIPEVGHMLTDSQRMGNLDLFRPSTLRAGIIPVVVTLASVHSLFQDFSLPGEAEGPDLGWHMQWTGWCENLPIARLRDPPPMSSSYGTEEL
ncbi:hypothetical protein GIB67_041450 [Kingdonia uniflora]|uniref:Aminotransferase-like plant mobile domain-containing protein n=1 Tax=Kingdonia uniflora TaxID=39325 RepID=A0A7J7LRI2_9MAGN|nr:hypothetical protein GIB67_041450 [Kingdonia uniflora]